MTPEAIKSAVRCGRWRRIFFDTFVVEGVPESFRQQAASASAGGAVCSHRCAAAIYGLEGIKAREIEVVAKGSFRPRRFPPSFIVHRTNHLPDDHVHEHAGIALTSVARTLIDLAGVTGGRVMRRAALSAVDKSLVTPDLLMDQIRCCGRSGRPGSASFRRFLVEMDWDLDFSDSELEDLAFELIRKEGFPAPKRLHKIYDGSLLLGEVDLAYPNERVGIEVDSFEFHGTRPAFVRDRGKLNGLIARADWRILHFVYEDAARPRRFLDDLTQALERP